MFCKLQIYLTQNSNEDLSCTKWYGNQVAIKVSVGLLFQKQHILLEITEASDNRPPEFHPLGCTNSRNIKISEWNIMGLEFKDGLKF